MMFLELYRKHLEARLCMPGTVRHHLRSVTLFLRWLREKDVRDVTLQDLLDYHQSLQIRRNKKGGLNTIPYRNTQARIVRGFFTFLYERKRILVNPGEKFPVLHNVKRLPKGVLSNAQVLRLLAQPDLSTLTGFRDRTILELLYSAGLRGLELSRLTVYDIDFKEHLVRVLQAKWNKDRIVPLGKTVADYLREYMAKVRPVLLQRNREKTAVDRLFLNNYGKALNVNALRRIVQRYAKPAGLPKNTAAHGRRHACATEMLKGGASVRHVQELLGHSSLNTTQIYARVAPVDLQKVHATTSPSERRRKLNVPEFELKGFRDKRNKTSFTKATWRR